jgi:hypothetical protein
MDRSFLSQKDVVDASREFICVRPATYMDAGEAEELTELVRTRSGMLENTAFTIIAPDGKRTLVRSSRSPSMTFRTKDRMLAAMADITKEYAAKRKQRVKQELPVYRDLKLALDVASCDSRPLVVGWAKGKKARVALEKTLAKLAWSEEFVGRYQYIVVEDADLLEPIEGFSKDISVAVVSPGEFGLEGKVLLETGERSGEDLAKLLSEGLEKFEPPTKDPQQHVRKGQRTGKNWETEVEVTGPDARKRLGQNDDEKEKEPSQTDG